MAWQFSSLRPGSAYPAGHGHPVAGPSSVEQVHDDERTPGKPIILLLLGPRTRENGTAAFAGRYGDDYDVLLTEEPQHLARKVLGLTEAGRSIAIIGVDITASHEATPHLVYKAQKFAPTARRVALVPTGGYRDLLPKLIHATAEGHIDTFLAVPTAPRDEEFHAAVVDMLSDWGWSTNQLETEGFQVVADRASPETARIVDYLQRMGMPYRRYSASSEAGARVVAAVGAVPDVPAGPPAAGLGAQRGPGRRRDLGRRGAGQPDAGRPGRAELRLGARPRPRLRR